MEIKCERCGQKEGQIKKRQNKSRKSKIYVQPLRKNIHSRKKREDVSGRAKRPCNRTVYGREQWKNCRTIAENKQKYVFEVDTAKS